MSTNERELCEICGVEPSQVAARLPDEMEEEFFRGYVICKKKFCLDTAFAMLKALRRFDELWGEERKTA